MDNPSQKSFGRSISLPISWKLLGATAIVGAVAAAIAIIGLKRIHTLNQNLTQTVDFLSTNVKLASLLKQDLIAVIRSERNMMLAKSEDGTERFAAVVDEVLKNMEERTADLRTLVNDEDRRLLDEFSVKWAQWKKNHADVRRFTNLNSDIQARNISVREAAASQQNLNLALEEIEQKAGQELDAARQNKSFAEADRAVEKQLLAANVAQTALKIQSAEKDLILAPNKEEMLSFETAFPPLLEELNDQLQKLERAAGVDSVAEMEKVKTAQQALLLANKRIRSAAGEKNNFLDYHFVYDVGAPLAADCENMLDVLIGRNERKMMEFRSASQKAYANSRNMLLGISVVGIFVSVAISFYTGHKIASRLKTLSQYAETIQNTGDLSHQMPELGSDEVGQLAESFDNMRQSLHRQTQNLSEQAAELAQLTVTLDTKNREMEQFVYTVSHDLKSPLVSCKGLLGLLREDIEDRDYEAVADSADRMDEATDRLNQIIDDLLMLSRIGRKTLKWSNVNVIDLLNDLVDELSDRIADEGAQINIDENIPPMMADKSDVRRVFENLITNALKYGCAGENQVIDVGGFRHESELRYFVRDYGPGIAPQYHDRVFGLFQRLETEQMGTGLGLASVAKIMQMHGGRAWVESEVGKGATFWLAFQMSPWQLRD